MTITATTLTATTTTAMTGTTTPTLPTDQNGDGRNSVTAAVRAQDADEQSDKPPSGNAKSTRMTTWSNEASWMGHVPMSRGCA
jgi:hypothetical protein